VGFGDDWQAYTEDLAKAWFNDEEAKERVSELLAQFQLDESAIEAEAVTRGARKFERADKMEGSYEARRHKALRQIFEYRNDFAQRLRNAANRIIEGKALALEDSSKKDGGRLGNGN
jgi:hypothetical protein